MTMPREIRESLDHAGGVSEFVIAVNMDIRGFSKFSETSGSVQAAEFLRTVYNRLIDDYFNDAQFLKLTGGRILAIYHYSRDNITELVPSIVDRCVRIVNEFSSLCTGDPMINCSVPDHSGVGISMGPACRLTSEEATLDYSGSVLNRASRLMDLARPRGVVFDSSIRLKSMPTATRKRCKAETLFVRSVAEREPITVHYTKA